MSKKEYKIGDKLQILKLSEDSNLVNIGDIGTLIQIIDDDYPLRMNINDVEDYGFKYEEVDYPIDNDKEISFVMFINDVDLHPDKEDILVFDISIHISNINNKKFNRHIAIFTYSFENVNYKNDDEIESELIDKVKQEVRKICLNEKKYNLSRYRKTKFYDSIGVVK